MERRSRDDIIQAQQEEIDRLRSELKEERGMREKGCEVRECERDLVRLRRLLGSKEETVGSLVEAAAVGRECLEGEEDEYAAICDAVEELGAMVASRVQPATPPPSKAPSATPLRSQIDHEASLLASALERLNRLRSQSDADDTQFNLDKHVLLNAIDSSTVRSYSSATPQPDLDGQISEEKQQILFALQDAKEDLLEEFATMRTRLRARISILEKNSESKQRRVGELHREYEDLEQKVLGVKENHRRIGEQYKSRLESSHSMLVRAKARETKYRTQLEAATTECEDLKLSLHSALGSYSARQHTPSKTTPSVRTPGRQLYNR